MIALEQIRAFAQGLVDEADHMIGRRLLAVLDDAAMDHDLVRRTVKAIVRDRVACVAGWDGFERGSIDRMIDDIANRAAEALTGVPQPMVPPTDQSRIPQRIREGLDRYAQHGLPTGDCLRAVLEDRLFAALDRADAETAAAMPAICAYVRCQLPPDCWGSPDVVSRWIAKVRA